MAIAQPVSAGTQPNLELLHALVRARAKLMLGMFSDFPDVTKGDLVQIGMIRALKVHHKFDPVCGNYSTLICNAVKRAIIDEHRQRTREVRRARNHGGPVEQSQTMDALRDIRDWYEAGESAGLPGGEGGNDETPEAWLRKVYKFAQGVFNDHRRGPRLVTIPGALLERRCGVVVRMYSRAQRVAVALLMRKRGLSVRGAAKLFVRRKSMRRAMGFEVAPSKMWFSKARGTSRRMFAETVYTCENN